ncbi:hypothetical protein CSUB01_10024 [Colletotrichum sublineola]|uniref:Mid2 domain-containing protein n=1 Tax=Colletotrichum sublineola TaxID=1173701 RepID=A0A066XYC2_COLSU|nr:hypothetical protein CSUB01_10024 [Colletotrichum sublineola]
MHLVRAVFAALVFPACCRAANQFLRPPANGPKGDFRENPAWVIGDKIDLQWKTDLPSVDILIWQETGENKGNFARIRVLNTASASTSLYPTSTSKPDILESVSMAPTTSATSIPSAPTPNPNTEQGGKSEGFSGGAVAAIAVGAVLGVLAVVGVVGWLLRRNLRGKKADEAHPSEQDNFVDAQEKPVPRPESVPQPQSEPLLFQDPRHSRHELAAESYSRNNEA